MNINPTGIKSDVILINSYKAIIINRQFISLEQSTKREKIRDEQGGVRLFWGSTEDLEGFQDMVRAFVYLAKATD
jgi:hypothetical protein